MNKNNNELEINRQNREEYEKLMEESSTQFDGYWDKNNWFVKIILLILLGVIIVGSVVVFLGYFGSM